MDAVAEKKSLTVLVSGADFDFRDFLRVGDWLIGFIGKADIQLADYYPKSRNLDAVAKFSVNTVFSERHVAELIRRQFPEYKLLVEDNRAPKE